MKLRSPFKHTTRNLCLVALSSVLLVFGCSSNTPAELPSGILVGDVLVQLSWSGAVNLDLGATTTPGGFVAANYNEPDADPDCTHEGDDFSEAPGAHSEQFTCIGVGSGDEWTIVIDNFTDALVNYTLDVEFVGGTGVTGFPLSFNSDIGPLDNQLDVSGGGERHSFGFN